jgi:hypothetical protein
MSDGTGWAGTQYQLNLFTSAGGGYSLLFAFSSQPVKLGMLDENGPSAFSKE